MQGRETGRARDCLRHQFIHIAYPAGESKARSHLTALLVVEVKLEVDKDGTGPNAAPTRWAVLGPGSQRPLSDSEKHRNRSRGRLLSLRASVPASVSSFSLRPLINRTVCSVQHIGHEPIQHLLMMALGVSISRPAGECVLPVQSLVVNPQL